MLPLEQLIWSTELTLFLLLQYANSPLPLCKSLHTLDTGSIQSSKGYFNWCRDIKRAVAIVGEGEMRGGSGDRTSPAET